MSDELNLVRDLAVILISAGVFTIISRALKQPLILGYILAGFLIGPSIGFSRASRVWRASTSGPKSVSSL